MITFFKNLFSKTSEVIDDQPSHKGFKARVRPFTKTSDPWYICEYFDKNDWVKFTENWTHSDTPRLWKKDKSKIFQKFDDAVVFCKQWSSIEEVKNYRQRMDAEFEYKLDELQKAIDSEQKTWESE